MIRRRRHDELGATLAPLASEPVGGPDPEFTDGLEARLRTIHASRPVAEVDAAAGAGARRRPPALGWLGWLVPAVAGAGIAGAVLLSGGGSGAPSGPTVPMVRVARAIDAQFIAPDGIAIPLHPGARLPDGTVVRTGAEGQVQADGATLGPDTEAVVHRGHLTVLRRGPRPTPPSPATTPPAPGPTRPAAPPTGQGRGGGGEPASPSSPGVPPPTPPGRGHGHPGPASLQLSVHQGPRGSEALSWSAYDGPALYGYVVLRSSPPADPAYPHDVIHFVPAGSAPSYVDAPGRAARYQVDAIDSSGEVLAASAVEH